MQKPSVSQDHVCGLLKGFAEGIQAAETSEAMWFHRELSGDGTSVLGQWFNHEVNFSFIKTLFNNKIEINT